MTDVPGGPRISIVVAAYGRPGVLGHALRSIQAQTYDHWDALVVGDAAGADTAAVVAELDDPRISFCDLAVNIGEQSGPNNAGIARTDGPLVAFLNQDDLWFPDHLEVALSTLEARAAHLVFSPNINVLPGGSLAEGRPVITLDGLSRNGRFDPANVDGAYPASAWLVRRQALDALGGWRAALESTIEPSQDLLARAHRRRMRLWSTGVATMVSLPSGIRPGSYVGAGDGAAIDEHAWFAARLGDPAFRAAMLALDERNTATAAARHAGRLSPRGRALRRAYVAFPSWAPPRVVHRALTRRLGRGEGIEVLRALRGLPRALPHADTPVDIRRAEVLRRCRLDPGDEVALTVAGGGARFLASGWSQPEAEFPWSDGPRAEIAVEPDTTEATTLHLTVAAYANASHPRQRIVVSVDGRSAGEWTLDHGDPVVLSVPLGRGRSGPRIVTLDLPDAAVHAVDARMLAVKASQLRLSVDEG